MQPIELFNKTTNQRVIGLCVKDGKNFFDVFVSGTVQIYPKVDWTIVSIKNPSTRFKIFQKSFYEQTKTI